MKRKKFMWLTMLLILVVPLLIYVFISFNNQKEVHIPDGETAKVITGEISDIVMHDEWATLYLEINEKVAAVKLQSDTLLQDANGKNCTYQDLQVGLKIEAVVNPTVWYDAWEDTETGEFYDMNVYYKCYKILIK